MKSNTSNNEFKSDLDIQNKEVNKKPNFDYKSMMENFRNNLAIISLSVLKNFRTYVYVIFMPIFFMLIYLWYSGKSSDLHNVNIFLYMCWPTFAIVFLVNTTVSEWKNSVFLKRIHSAGVSRMNFFVSLYVFNFLLSVLSIMIGFVVLIIASYTYLKSDNYSFFQKIGFWSFREWMGIIYSLCLSTCISISLGIIISGLINSIALSQSITILVVLFNIVFSDCLLSLDLLAISKPLNILSYFAVHKYSVWTGIISSSFERKENAFWNAARPVFYTSFGFKMWIASLTGFICSTGLIVGSYFSFRWNNKK
ncbi:ABC transporter ATP-binding protein [Spiroplasma helicoides]|uniref:ABC transporter ATP-binding protein n=1 Tax=Spiroplasma helicoides TaxID=216938 RepID=A0A1B3SKQ3_9MOLU|nr:hypothetical protein [Spiroplasma helicoides]AOG60500.1 ABC transporter ATP-binding protein [Spiroplasma helicoides]